MPAPYNPQGALNGLFAPAYIPGNPGSVAATTAWNANRQAQPGIAPPPPGTAPPLLPTAGGKLIPGSLPGTGGPMPVGRGIANNPKMQALLSQLPPQVQSRFGGKVGMPAPAGGSFTFTEPTLPPAAVPAAAASVNPMRNNIAQTLMNQPPAAQNPLVGMGQSFFGQVAAPFQKFAADATRLAMPNLASQLPSASQGAAVPQTPMKRPGYGV